MKDNPRSKLQGNNQKAQKAGTEGRKPENWSVPKVEDTDENHCGRETARFHEELLKEDTDWSSSEG